MQLSFVLLTVLVFVLVPGSTEAWLPPGIWFPIPIPTPSAATTAGATCPATGCCIKGTCTMATNMPASMCTVSGTTATCDNGGTVGPACFNSAGTGCSAASASCMAMPMCSTACPPASPTVMYCPT